MREREAEMASLIRDAEADAVGIAAGRNAQAAKQGMCRFRWGYKVWRVNKG